MSELGTRLKTAREEKGYSLDELQRVTKIQKRYLTAIEAGDFSKMPGDFYARAFVKSYAEAVGLNPDMIFEEHKDELPKPKKEQADLPPRVNRSKSKPVAKKSRMGSLLPTLIAVAFIIAIGLAVWLFRQGDVDDTAGVPRDNQQTGNNIEISDDADDENDNENNEPENDGNENEGNENGEAGNNEPDNEEADEEETEPAEQTLSFEESSGNRYTYSLTDADEFNVTISFTDSVWLDVYDTDDDMLYSTGYSSGDEADFDLSDESRVRFNVGNTRGAEIFVNEEQLEYQNDTHHQHIIIEREE